MMRFPSISPGIAVPRLAALTAALLLASCANFTGIQSSAQPQLPENLAASASLPAQGGAWPALDWAAQIP